MYEINSKSRSKLAQQKLKTKLKIVYIKKNLQITKVLKWKLNHR